MNKYLKKMLKKILSKNKKVEAIAVDINKKIFLDTSIPEITPICTRVLDTDENFMRLNLLIPTINVEQIFGGITTAIKIFEKIALEKNMNRRIVVTDGAACKNDFLNFPNYRNVSCLDDDVADNQIVIFNDRSGRTIPVAKNDIFVSSAWWTEYIITDVIEWQKKQYNLAKENKSVYIVQDYEPGFYEWSTRYMLAKSTYIQKSRKVGIFNTKFLYDYFKKMGHKFDEEYIFEPFLNEKLKNILDKNVDIKKEKIVFIYGRPSVKRNAFELIVESLKISVRNIDYISDWRFISLGEKHQNIDLGKGVILESYGKVSLEEYAEFMLKAYLGISLMVSPHPSYPPLEMASFGMNVITNTFEDRNLSSMCGNIYSIDNINIQKLSDCIVNRIREYDDKKSYICNNIFNKMDIDFTFLNFN